MAKLGTSGAIIVAAVAGLFSVEPAGGAQPSTLSFGDGRLIGEQADMASNVSAGDVDGDKDVDLILVKGRHQAGGIHLLVNEGRNTFRSVQLAQTPDNSYAAPFRPPEAAHPAPFTSDKLVPRVRQFWSPIDSNPEYRYSHRDRRVRLIPLPAFGARN